MPYICLIGIGLKVLHERTRVARKKPGPNNLVGKKDRKFGAGKAQLTSLVA